jgi:hypothetical protein
MMSDEQEAKRMARIDIRCLEVEKAQLQQKAADCGMTVTAYMVSAALGRQTRSKVDAQILNELRRLGGLQKHLFTEGGGKLSKELAAVLAEVQAAIARVAAK